MAVVLSADDLNWIHDRVGDTPDDAALALVAARTDITTREAVVREVLSRRLANMLAAPASFTIPGEYGQNNSANITALQAQLDQVGGIGDGSSSLPTVNVVDPEDMRVR